MKELEITIGFIMALEEGNLGRVSELLTMDMVFCGPVKQPLNRLDYLAIITGLRAAIPNLKFHFYNVEVDGRFVSMTTQVTGSHTFTLPAIYPGMTSHPPSGLSFKLPLERMEFALEAHKIARIHVDPVPGGGFTGILEQLNIFLPEKN
jgi:hypothetical protein